MAQFRLVRVMALCTVALLLSFYTFLVGPSGNGPNTVVDPMALMVQIVSMSGAPALVLQRDCLCNDTKFSE